MQVLPLHPMFLFKANPIFMRIVILLASLLLFSWTVSAQNEVTWSFDLRSLGHCEYEVVCKATIKSGWFMLSAQNDSIGFDLPTTIFFESEGIQPDGKLIGKCDFTVKREDSVWGGENEFSTEATFSQRFTLIAGTTKVKGFVENLCFSNQMALPPTPTVFSFNIPFDKSCGTAKFK
jgi:hypothetical protein